MAAKRSVLRWLPWYDEWEFVQRERRVEAARQQAIASRIAGEHAMGRIAVTVESYRSASRAVRRRR